MMAGCIRGNKIPFVFPCCPGLEAVLHLAGPLRSEIIKGYWGGLMVWIGEYGFADVQEALLGIPIGMRRYARYRKLFRLLDEAKGL